MNLMLAKSLNIKRFLKDDAVPTIDVAGIVLPVKEQLQQFRVIRDHLNSKCLTSIIVFDIHVRSSI